MDRELLFDIVFHVVGGLGIFLLGMKYMSEGMQNIAGDRMRRMINAATSNRLMGCGVGTLITMFIQSSSITTVMVVGMVNVGLMTLAQAIGVILGANIGTTITAWIITLKIGAYGLPLLGISAVFFLFSRSDRVRFFAMLFLGLGMVFYGLLLMKKGLEPLRGMPEFTAWFARFEPKDYLGVLKCCLAGALLTAVLQSSSATIAITIGLASQGLIAFPTAVALVLGENIGTTITAILATIGASTNARRAGLAHFFINVIGVAYITVLFKFYVPLIEHLFGNEIDTMNAGQAIALSHTVFNVFNAAIFLFLAPLLARLLVRLLPEKAIEEKPRLTYLDVRMLTTPAIGIEQSEKAVLTMSETVGEMIDSLRSVIENEKPNEKLQLKLFDEEKQLDAVQKEIVEFLHQLLAGEAPPDVVDSGLMQIRLADEYESISDYIVNILKLKLKLHQEKLKMADQGKDDLLELHKSVTDYIRWVNEIVEQKRPDFLAKANDLADQITSTMKEFRSHHLSRVKTEGASPKESLIFTDMLNSYRRIKDHTLNIAEALAGEK